jgi:hypothetical protein
VPTFLISSGRIGIQNIDPNGGDRSSFTNYISMFADRVLVTGPWEVDEVLTLQHLPSAVEDEAGGLLDRLYDLGVLPNTNAGMRANFQKVTGSWRELDPDNPPPLN